MKNRREYILMASELALKTRLALGYDQKSTICVYDAVEKIEIELRFDDNPGLEGVYYKATTPKIIIGSHRPAGRKAFTCAHELGHHVFDHGTRVDEVKPDAVNIHSNEKEEFLADCFASFFLMPKRVIARCFSVRGWSPVDCSAVEYFTIANSCGVSYEAVINHIFLTLRMISYSKAEELKRTKPKDIRALIMGTETKEDVFLVDFHWGERAIDIQVGDYVILPFNTKFEGSCAEYIELGKRGIIYKAVKPGIGKYCNSEKNWSSFVRVSRRNYAGRSLFRHLEEVEDE
jgi:Zn-dependent peptidase ImmA (M78 family)